MLARFLHLTDCQLSPALTCGAEPGQDLKLCGSTSPPAETKQSQSLRLLQARLRTRFPGAALSLTGILPT